MKAMMPQQIRIRERNQITLPATITNAAKLSPNDALEVSFTNGVITLVPVSTQAKRRSILDYVGSAKGVWGKTAEEVDALIRSERDSWER